MSARGKGFFVAGTDTGVGKTAVSSALVRRLACAGWAAVGMKPVAAGARRAGAVLRNDDVESLARASSVRAPRALRNPYVLAPPIAPHIAAAEAGVTLDLNVIMHAYRALAARAQVVVVEGAGGLLVPLDERRDMGDLARRLRLPVILVVGVRLGCISHALLTVEAIERRGLTLAGWVANRIDARMPRYLANVESLRSRIDAPLLAEVPWIASARLRAATLQERLDIDALSRWLPRHAAT